MINFPKPKMNFILTGLLVCAFAVGVQRSHAEMSYARIYKIEVSCLDFGHDRRGNYMPSTRLITVGVELSNGDTDSVDFQINEAGGLIAQGAQGSLVVGRANLAGVAAICSKNRPGQNRRFRGESVVSLSKGLQIYTEKSVDSETYFRAPRIGNSSPMFWDAGGLNTGYSMVSSQKIVLNGQSVTVDRRAN